MSVAPNEEDREMVHAVLTGQAGAFERLLRQHQRLVWLLVQRLVREPEAARELCQEVFLRVSRQLAGFRFESRLSTWIGRIATSVALRHLEKQRIDTIEFDAELHDLGHEDTPAHLLDRAQRLQRLRDAIDALPPMPRLCLTLFHLEELPIAEVAALTHLPEGTVKSHLHRGRDRLRALLENHDEA
ncbi:MAG: sigma-70 family RNA polymerase sigma factor [Burkholderiales bacterium]|nr:sigma-70 family RNA polymerase sigma factor [Burkholderiales bacterium]